MQLGYFYLYEEHQPVLGKLIGKHGCHFKHIKALSGCRSLSLCKEYIQIIGKEDVMDKTFQLLRQHCDAIVSDHFGVLKGYDHLPINMRPLKLRKSVKKN